MPASRILPGLLAVLMLLTAGCALAPAPSAIPSLTPVPTDTATPRPTTTPPPTATLARTALPTVTPVPVDAPPPTPYATRQVVAESAPPPLTISLPEGWRVGYGLLPMQNSLSGGVPVAIYTGPLADVPGATGTIVVLWNFPSISASGEPDLWSDGVRFLRGALLDSSCNIGLDLVRSFAVGERDDAVGTYFQAVGCSGEPDTSGWFAGLREQGGHYVFYAYVDPLERFNPAIPTLQGILDSVRFTELATAVPD